MQNSSLDKAEEQPGIAAEALAHVNRLVAGNRESLMQRRNALADELAYGDAPLSDFATQYARLDAESAICNFAIQRIVAVHQPAAKRTVLCARHAVAQAEENIAWTEATKSAAEFLVAMAPVLVQQGLLDVSGGLTEALLAQAQQASKRTRDAEAAIQAHDERTAKLQSNFIF